MKIEAGQWWETRRFGRAHIRYVDADNVSQAVFAVTRDDDMSLVSGIFSRDGKYFDCEVESGYDLVKHLPDCTGWDWEPPKPVDPGEGWRLLEVGEVMQRGDQGYGWVTNTWFDVGPQNNGVPLQNELAKVRRRIQPDVPADWQLIGGVPGGMLYFRPTEAM